MARNSIASQTQADIRVSGQIDTFSNRFGTLLHRCGIRKRHGHSIRSLIQAIFTLPFPGHNFYRGIVIKPDQPLGKDASYEILKGVRHNWRKVLLSLARQIFSIINRRLKKRRDIEVFFKMIKQHLRLAKEIQCRDFDALIDHASIVFMRYMFLACLCRISIDPKRFGDLFHACCDEIRDISFLEALMRILTLTADRMRAIGSFCRKTADAFFYAAMDVTLNFLGIAKNKPLSFFANPES